jgi:hypothetical protein
MIEDLKEIIEIPMDLYNMGIEKISTSSIKVRV